MRIKRSSVTDWAQRELKCCMSKRTVCDFETWLGWSMNAGDQGWRSSFWSRWLNEWWWCIRDNVDWKTESVVSQFGQHYMCCVWIALYLIAGALLDQCPYVNDDCLYPWHSLFESRWPVSCLCHVLVINALCELSVYFQQCRDTTSSKWHRWSKNSARNMVLTTRRSRYWPHSATLLGDCCKRSFWYTC